MVNGMKVKEILPPSGGPWGSCYIDDQFELLLHCLFTAEWVNEFKEEHANIWCAVIYNFQKSKETFYDNKHLQNHNVSLPVELVAFIQDKLDDHRAKKIDLEDEVESRSVFGRKN